MRCPHCDLLLKCRKCGYQPQHASIKVRARRVAAGLCQDCQGASDGHRRCKDCRAHVRSQPWYQARVKSA